jgi:hypothetical protein
MKINAIGQDRKSINVPKLILCNKEIKMNEIDHITRKHGKWSEINVPHKGWTCIDIEDKGEPISLCEMCESQIIRYIHYMKHPQYEDILGVGCVCAGKMEDNYVSAKIRDDFMKKRAAKRIRWINNSHWKISQKGNEWIKSDGYIIVMKQNGNIWSALIKNEDETFEKWSQRKYESVEQAKLSAFDYLTKILSEENRNSL